jgi:ubiquinone biosynthesis protein COQ9
MTAAAETKSADWAQDAEQQLLDAALTLVPAHGWTARMVKLAGRALGFSEGETELLVPHGPADLAALLTRRYDARTLEVLAGIDPASLKIRERIRRACEVHLDAAAGDETILRRLMGFFALPRNLQLGGKLLWESADHLWRWAGDTATDENHYSKRAILAGILSGALAIRLSDGRQAALDFVDRRIDNVMAYEKWKATGGFRPGDWLANAAQALGKMRYGA